MVLKSVFMLVSICWGISCTYGSMLTAQELKDLSELRSLAPKVVSMTSNSASSSIESKVWIDVLHKDSLSRLNPLDITSLRETYPTSIWNFDTNQFSLELQPIYQVDFFLEANQKFLVALKKRKSSGSGLSFETQADLNTCQQQLNVLGKKMSELNPHISASNIILHRYSSKFSTLIFMLQQMKAGTPRGRDPMTLQSNFQSSPVQDFLSTLENKGGLTPVPLEPSLKDSARTVLDEFIITRFFFEGALSVCGPALNTWGGFLKANATIYAQAGDDSLLSLIPKVVLKD